MANAALREKPDAGNAHVRFDEGEVVAARPRGGARLSRARGLRCLGLAVSVGLVSCAGFGSQVSTWAYFKNAVSADWMEAGNWFNENGTASGELPLHDGAHNASIRHGQTCVLTNAYSGFYNFTVVANATGNTRFEIASGGKIGSAISSIYTADGATGVVCVASGGTWAASSPNLPEAGIGIVTNAGSWYADGVVTLGYNAGSFGRFVHTKGASVSYGNNFRSLFIGRAGRGELVVGESAEFTWPIYNNNGCIFLGCSQEDNRLVIETNGVFHATRFYVGGCTVATDGNPKTPGRGEVRLRGGSLAYDLTAHTEYSIWLGAFDGADEVDPTSYGAIRGWGKVTGYGDHTGDWSAHYLIGYGEICADGEGDESRILDCTQGMTEISNALPATVVTESGWRAVNRGIVYPRGSRILDTAASGTEKTACVGCQSTLEKPDLVNSIRVTARGLTTYTDQRYFGYAVCAPDRTDAHTNSLPTQANVLGVFKVGVFDNRQKRAYANRSPVASGEVMVRYDQTKIRQTDSRLELWFYAEATGKWTRVASLKAGERPADCSITSATIDYAAIAGNGNGLTETFDMGTYAVVERASRGFVLEYR